MVGNLSRNNKRSIAPLNTEPNYKKFKELACNKSLSSYEKIEFPHSYCAGYEPLILNSIISNLTLLNKNNQRVLGMGPGSELPKLLIEHCANQSPRLAFCDSEEVLACHSDYSFLHKVSGIFFTNIDKIKEFATQFDARLCLIYFIIYMLTPVCGILLVLV